ncbi:MAG: hypothetical protein NTY12_03445 [Candidatus Falkowbacteria bacterium]|nr:hypothetical protein [Candidatus Falkowbacteria bacterium]
MGYEFMINKTEVKEKAAKPNINESDETLLTKMQEVCGPELKELNPTDLEHLRKEGRKDDQEWYVMTGDKFFVKPDGSMTIGEKSNEETKKKFREIYG